MLLHIGSDIVVKEKDIIFIMDYKCIKNNKINKIFMDGYSVLNGKVVDISGKDIKSVIVVQYDNEHKIYLSPISSSTLQKRTLETFKE